MRLEQLIDTYFSTQKRIFEYFGYEEDWVKIPLSSHLADYWWYDDLTKQVWYSDNGFTVDSVMAGEDLYSGTLYTQRFLSKWIYETPDHTMICVDTHCDGNKFLMVFDNTKKLVNPSEELKRAFARWGY